MQALIKTTIITVLILLLTGCGFHLRNATSLPTQLHKVYLAADNPYGGFEITLGNQLTAAGVTLVKQSHLAQFTLHVTSNYVHSSVSSGTSTQARVYSLTYAATISISNAKGQTILESTDVSVTRNVTLSPNEVFEVSTQVETIKQEMQIDLSTKVLNILGSKATFQLLANSK